jgi:uncharacterized protein YbjT (DUF2867 family)
MVLILAATGMFASRVLRETAARGAPVRALVQSAARAPEPQRAAVMDDRIEIRERNAR